MNLLVGRILLALVFLIAGIRKLMAPAASAGYLAKLGFPAPEVMVWVAIAFELGGAILLIVGWKTRWAAYALALFTLVASFAAHRFWEISDAGQYANQMNHFLKNVAIIGGMLILAVSGPGPQSVDGRRRSG